MRCSRTALWGVAGVSLLLLLSAGALATPARTLPHLGASGSGTWSTDAVPLPPSARATPLPPETPVAVSMTLRSPNSPGLAELAESLAGPGGDHQGYLSEAQFEARYSPTPAEVAVVENFLRTAGGTSLAVTADRFGVSSVVPAHGVESAFHVQLEQFGSESGRPLYTAVGIPALPPAVAALTAGVDGLSDASASGFTPHLHVLGQGATPPRPSTPRFVIDNLTGETWFIGSDYTQAYGVSSLFPPSTQVANATFPTNIAVATLLMGGYNGTTSTDLPPFDPVAVSAYFNDTFPAAWPHPTIEAMPVTIDGTTPPLPGGNGAISDTSLDETENALDLEMAGSLAPGATVVNFYFAGSLYLAANATPTLGDVADDFATELSDALSHSYAPARLAAVSNSFGLSDLNDSLWDTEMLHAAVTGVTIVASSGDQADAPNDVSGRAQGQWPGWPATAGFNDSATIAVGGVSMALGGAPAGWSNETDLNASFDSNITGITGGSAWYDTLGGPGNVSGTEGGLSGTYSEPDWQFDSDAQANIVAAGESQGATSLGRAVPDVAFAANDTIAYDAHDTTGVYYDLLEGTSVAAPLFAGFLASCSAVSGHSYGVLDPELYRIASYFAAFPALGSADPFLPVTDGSNYVFSASSGWDALTGWGQLDALRFLVADATPAISEFNYTGPTPVLPPPPAPASYSAPYGVLLILGVGIALAVIAVIFVGRNRAPPSHVPPPYGGPAPPAYAGGGPSLPPVPPAGGGPPPLPPSMMFCPYCGQPRPAEPVRCPSCGAL